MKTAVLFEEGRAQIVLTPETAMEKDLLNKIEHNSNMRAYLKAGEFYQCRGGYATHHHGTSNKSLMIVIDDQGEGNAQ